MGGSEGPLPSNVHRFEGLIVRRFAFPLLLVAALVAGSTAVAGSAVADTSDLSTLAITGNVGEKPTVAVTEPVKVTSSAREVVSTGTGQKAAKGNKVTFDYVIVNGRTGDEIETSFGAQPVSLVLDKNKAQADIVEEPHRHAESAAGC